MSKRIFLSVSVAGFILLGLAIYTGFWIFMASQIRMQVENFIANAQEQNVHVITRAFGVRNYPFTPEAYFTGRISADGVTIEVPLLEVRSLFLPERPLTVEAPKGLSILAPADTTLWSVDSLRIDTVIPASLPSEMTHEEMSAWKNAGGTIDLQNIEMRKSSLNVKGSGQLVLDNALQPAGSFHARVTGHMEFLNWLQQQGYVKTKQAILASAVLSGLSKTDPETNESYMESDLTLQNQTLFVGPLRLAYLPAVQWAWRSGPDRLQ